MRILAVTMVLPLLLLSSYVAAEDGLVVQFKISEQAIGDSSRSSLNSSVLMRFSEEVSVEIGGQYVLKIESQKKGDDRVSLVVWLKDIMDGKPYYVGARPADLKIGEQTELEFENYETTYTISLDTSYGKLPESS